MAEDRKNHDNNNQNTRNTEYGVSSRKPDLSPRRLIQVATSAAATHLTHRTRFANIHSHLLLPLSSITS
ncbi:MAG: hypothetical protein ACE5IO_07255, partial [Thermoplasmata archaeon]